MLECGAAKDCKGEVTSRPRGRVDVLCGGQRVLEPGRVHRPAWFLACSQQDVQGREGRNGRAGPSPEREVQR